MDPTKTREIDWEPSRSEHQGAGRVVCTPRTAPHSFKLHVARHIQERYIHRQDDKTTVADFDQTPKTTRKGSSHNNNDDKEKDRNNLSFPLSLCVCVSWFAALCVRINTMASSSSNMDVDTNGKKPVDFHPVS